MNRAFERLKAEQRLAAKAQAEAEVTLSVPAPSATKPMLLLPAPIEDPTIASIQALAASFAAVSAKAGMRR